jgi:16S rRNA processing protein RimM
MNQIRSVMIAVGRITRSVGLKGELNLSMVTKNARRFEGLKHVWIGSDEQHATQHEVRAVRSTRTAVVMRVQGIESKPAADERRGQLVFVAEEEAVVPPKGTYFVHEIVGMDVETESGEIVGTIREVMEMPANDVWVVDAKGKEILLPAIKEVIRSVDVQRRRVIIRPMEGLLE